MFGEQRLFETVAQAAQRSAQAGTQAASAQSVLEAIDRAVVDFIGEGLPSDDLTLLVLKRLPES